MIGFPATRPDRSSIAIRLGAAGVVVVLAAFAPRTGETWDIVVGLTLACSAAALIILSPSSAVGDLLTVTGVAWFCGNFVSADRWLVGAAALRLAFVHRAVLTHAIVSYPTGRLRRRTSGLLAALYATSLIPWMMTEPGWMLMWTAGVAVVAGVELFGRRTSAGRRVVVIAVAAWVAALMIVESVLWTRSSAPWNAATVYSIGIICACSVLVAGALSSRLHRQSVADAVLDVAQNAAPTPRQRRAMRDGLAAALGDPNVDVLFASDDGWTDELGRPTPLPDVHVGHRTLTFVPLENRDVAVIVHDAALSDDPRLLGAIRAATSIAAANVALRARLVEDVAALSETRSRMLTAAQASRDEMAARLRDGAAARLDRIEALVAPIAANSGPSSAPAQESLVRLVATRNELESLASGLGPAVIGEVGLAAALSQLGDGAVPIRITVDEISTSLAPTVYLVVAEAVTNVVKHAGASRIDISVTCDDRLVTVIVNDDGCGGAEAREGSGLAGLLDRVTARRGTVEIKSDSAGTRLVATIPVTG